MTDIDVDLNIDKYDYWLLRKPLSEDTIAENVLEHGVGGLNIDECRVGTDTVQTNRYTPGRDFTS